MGGGGGGGGWQVMMTSSFVRLEEKKEGEEKRGTHRVTQRTRRARCVGVSTAWSFSISPSNLPCRESMFSCRGVLFVGRVKVVGGWDGTGGRHDGEGGGLVVSARGIGCHTHTYVRPVFLLLLPPTLSLPSVASDFLRWPTSCRMRSRRDWILDVCSCRRCVCKVGWVGDGSGRTVCSCRFV